MYKIKGTHHVSAMTDDIARNHKFMTEVIGLRLVKKTVNQDDVRTYHTFYADEAGNAGTDMTYFDVPNQVQGRPGNNSLYRASFRVPNDEALDFYKKRFEEYDVEHGDIETLFDRKILRFEEPDGQKYFLISDENDDSDVQGVANSYGPVPEEYVARALGPVEIHTSRKNDLVSKLEEYYDFKVSKTEGDYTLLEVDKGGNGASIILKESDEKNHKEGYGEIHHVALLVDSAEDLEELSKFYDEKGLHHTGIVDRFYFKAIYTRIERVLFEVSTRGPGFDTDEPYETMGETLALPPFLEGRRDEIEAKLKPFES